MTAISRTGRWPAILFALALITSVIIFWTNILPMLDGRAWARFVPGLDMVLIHAWSGLFVLIFGAAALYVGWTKRHFRWHKWVGYLYLSSGSVNAAAALLASFLAFREPKSLYIATGTIAIFWFVFAAMAWRAAWNRRLDTHREWVIRSYVLTWTFVGCRLATKVDFYPWLGAEGVTAAIWVNWIVPVLLCEVALQWRRGSSVSQPDRV